MRNSFLNNDESKGLKEKYLDQVKKVNNFNLNKITEKQKKKQE